MYTRSAWFGYCGALLEYKGHQPTAFIHRANQHYVCSKWYRQGPLKHHSVSRLANANGQADLRCQLISYSVGLHASVPSRGQFQEPSTAIPGLINIKDPLRMMHQQQY
jgi:hypothetical protein